MKIAIVGGGISGVAAADYLHSNGHDMTLYEKESTVGGHAKSYTHQTPNGPINIQLGTSVLLEHYVNLFSFLEKKGADLTQNSTNLSSYFQNEDMGFHIRTDDLKTFIIGALSSSSTRRISWDFLTLYAKSSHYLKRLENGHQELSYRAFFEKYEFYPEFRNFFPTINAMLLLANPVKSIENAPASAVLHYNDLMQLLTPIHKQLMKTYSFAGGAKQTYDILISSFKEKIKYNSAVDRVVSETDGVVVSSNGIEQKYDKVILATSTGTQALSMLANGNMTDDESQILSNFSGCQNKLILHTDDHFAAFSGKIEMYNIVQKNGIALGKNYLNQIMNLSDSTNYYLSYGGMGVDPDEAKVLYTNDFEHPLIDRKQWTSFKKKALNEIQGKRGIYYAGTWTNAGEGCHEKGYISGRHAAALVLGEQYEPLKPKRVPPIHYFLSRVFCRLKHFSGLDALKNI
ncbi:MAG: hypothetical protein DRR16_11185 [Candidatus Parabeggiatoa sp. nov. 3]|nr:MAG: hypothetical protein DRR00_09475 [Gammaproteobacteria bacterium]RKZ66364.1 MAG: hypothetical protein DRQ99_09905 [Gammaproteobacteria bacterium]RKZ85825.1 MAG: hypothetical protein DRR16_11185 [Gammaproteobacteria bacterium]HEW97555.1 hypothetical protein [Beggiatoa sp.]